MTEGRTTTEAADESVASAAEGDGSARLRKTRRRGRALEIEILQAAREELEDKGWRRFTMEGVAARAGTGKAPLYARWPNRVALVRAAMLHNRSRRSPEEPTLGSLRDDLIRALQRGGAYFETPFGEAMRAVISEAGATPFPATDEEHPIEPVLQCLQHAYERDNPSTDGITFRIDPHQIPVAVINLGPQIVSLDFLANGVAVSQSRIEQIVDLIWLPLLTHHAGCPAS
jgi:AcrR family transcriptional regulator